MTTNKVFSRGVQAREIEITNSNFDMDTSEVSPPPTDSSSTHAPSDQTSSYLQVIVQKHRRGRLPTASSPVTSPPAPTGDHSGALPPTVFLAACPALAALQSAYDGVVRGLELGAETCQGSASEDKKNIQQPPTKISFKRDYSSSDDETDVVELLHLERVGETLVARGGRGGRGGRVGHTARRMRRRGARLLAALLLPPRLLLDLPIAFLLQLERCALEIVREVVVEGSTVAAEALGKPTLAAAHNALTAVLAAVAGAARGVREALRPIAGAALDAVEPLARVAATLRLVDVYHVQHAPCHCCTQNAPPAVV